MKKHKTTLHGSWLFGTMQGPLSGLFFLLLLGCPSFLFSQVPVHQLNLQSSIDLVLEQSHTIRILKADLEEAEYTLRSATSRFRTHLTYEMTLPNYTETVSQWEDSSGVHYFPVKKLSYSSRFHLWQPLPTDGRIYIASGMYNIDDFNKDKKSLMLNTRVGFEQPLSALFSYNEIKSGFKQAKLNYELSMKELKRAELTLVYEISRLFYGLVSTNERKNIAYQSLLRQMEVYEIARNKLQAGLIPEVEALQIQVDLGEAQNDYDLSIVNYQASANDFKHQLVIPLQDSVVVTSDLGYEIVFVDIQEAVERGLQHRMEIREREIQLELQQLNLKRLRSDGMIRGRISAYYDFIGVDEKLMPITFQDAFDNSWSNLRGRPVNRGVELSVVVPIWDWGENRARVKAQKARMAKARYSLDDTKVIIEKEIISTVNRLNSALRRLQLLEKNIEVAEQSFAISNARFVNGDIDNETLALARARLNNAYVSRLEAYSSYQLLLADLTRQTFYDYVNDKSVLD
jgi:outer membrane protein